MKPLAIIAVGWCLIGLSDRTFADWEVAYPMILPPAEDLPLLSLGRKNMINPHNGSDYLLGSRSGYVIEQTWDSQSGAAPFTRNRESARVRKLPVTFDITAISSFREHWILGGAEGQFAFNSREGREGYPEAPGLEPISPVEEIWETSQLPTSDSISYLGTIPGKDGRPGDRIVAWNDNKRNVYISDDIGATWKVVNPPLYITDLITFRGDVYVIGTSLDGPIPDVSDKHELALYRSNNGEDWTLLWSVFVEDSTTCNGGLAILSDAFHPNGEARQEARRLYVKAIILGVQGYNTLQVSTLDGETWLDHDSASYSFCQGLYCDLRAPWNPLDIPEPLRFLKPLDTPEPLRFSKPPPGFLPSNDHNYTVDSSNDRTLSEDYSGDFHVVRYYSNHEWIEGLVTGPLIARNYPSKGRTTAWDGIAAVFENDRIVSILDGEPSEYSLPGLEFPEVFWKQLINVGGIYYLTARVREPETKNVLFVSADLVEWEPIPLPENADPISILPMGNGIAARYEVRQPNEPPVDSLAYWDREWGEPIPLPDDTQSLVYVPASHTWYRLVLKALTKSENVVVERMTPEGSFEPFISFKTDTWPGYLNRMECPDDENLVVYGDAAETLVINTDGSVLQAHPWHFYPENGYSVQDVHFINGWYYLGGGANLRTRDFMDYEVVPFDSPIDSILDDGNALYAFAGGVIYEQPLERGYLHSIEHNRGWRHSDWLGWFVVLDESKGRIYHLLLGETTVTEVRPGSYTLNTAALGNLSVQVDWMPWFQRVDDGIWFWLDQNSFPGRVWNDDEKSWIDLVP